MGQVTFREHIKVSLQGKPGRAEIRPYVNYMTGRGKFVLSIGQRMRLEDIMGPFEIRQLSVPGFELVPDADCKGWLYRKLQG